MTAASGRQRPRAPFAGTGSGSAVSIQGFAFDPSTIQVAAGTEVVWTNQDPTEHTVTADDGSFDSRPVAPDGTFSVTLGGNGSVTYTCVIHPTMKGTVQVG
jgi:plastocyanin